MTPDPLWPTVVLAVIQLVDAAFCVIPLRFVTECLSAVGLPERYRPLLAPLKAAAGVGLIVGAWIPNLAALVAACLVVYFCLAVGAHVRVSDYGRNIASATFLLILSVLVLATTL